MFGGRGYAHIRFLEGCRELIQKAHSGKKYMGIVLTWLSYGSLYCGTDCNTGPVSNFPHFGDSSFGQLPYRKHVTAKAYHVGVHGAC